MSGESGPPPLSLAESEEFTRVTLENISDAVFITDDDGRFTFVCPKVEVIFGFSYDEVTEMGRIDSLLGHVLFDQEELERAGELRDVAVAITRKDGGARHLSVNVKRVSIGGGTVLYVCRDITERFEAERLVRESAERFAIAFGALPDAAVVTSVVDERIVEVNEGFTRLFGYEAEEAVGRMTVELGIWLDPDDRARFVELEREERARDYEFGYRTKSGDEGMAEASGTLLEIGGEPCSLTVVRDITDRTRAQAALRQSEERFRTAFQAGPGMSMVSRIGDGRVIEVNEHFLKDSGYSRAEVIGKTTLQLGIWVDPDERDRFTEALRDRGEAVRFPMRFRNKSGEIRLIEASASFIELGGERYVFSVGTDVTARKKAEEALRRSEEKFRTAFQANPSLSAITTVEEGRLIEVNEAFLSATEYSRAEVIGKTTTELGLWVDPSERAPLKEHLLAEGGTARAIVRFRTKTGRELLADLSSSLMRLEDELYGFSVAVDVTARARAEEALQQSEERFRRAFQAGPGLSTISAIEDGRLIEVNEAFLRATGYERDEVIGKTSGELGLWVDDEERRQVRELLLEKGEVTQFPMRGRTKSGEVRWVEASATFIQLGEQRPVLLVATDVSARRKAEQALLYQAGRLELLYDVVAGLLRAESVETVATAALKRVRQLVQSERASLLVFEDGGEPTFLAVDTAAEVAARGLDSFPADEFVWSDAFFEGEIELTNDLASLEHPTGVQRVLLSEGIHCYVRVPLMVEGTVIGSLNLGARSAEAFTPDRLETVREVADSMAVAVRHSRLMQDASEANLRLRALSRQLLEKQEAERRHLARELHDEVGQTLALVKKCLMSAKLQPESAELIPGLDMYIDLVGETIARVRDLSLNLRPSVLDDMGLVPALHWLADRLAGRAGMHLDVSGDEEAERLPRELELACFRLAQEATTNAMKHAAAKLVRVQVDRTRDEVVIAVSDDGIGFDVRAAVESAKAGNSMGLLGMEERVRLAGGSYRIVSEAGKGTRVEARFQS